MSYYNNQSDAIRMLLYKLRTCAKFYTKIHKRSPSMVNNTQAIETPNLSLCRVPKEKGMRGSLFSLSSCKNTGLNGITTLPF